jgi:hypothetical protein
MGNFLWTWFMVAVAIASSSIAYGCLWVIQNAKTNDGPGLLFFWLGLLFAGGFALATWWSLAANLLGWDD